MMTYTIAKHSKATAALGRMLEARGTQETTSLESADVVLLAADSVSELADALAHLGTAARKTIVIGSLPSISVTRRPDPGTLEGTLEEFRPLGILNWTGESPNSTPGFVGPKDLAERLGAGYMKAFATRHYGSWIRRDDEDLADFVCKVFSATADCPSTTEPTRS